MYARIAVLLLNRVVRPTGRLCPRPRCGCRLVDALLDWEDELPEPDFERAIEEAGKCKPQWDGGKGGGLALCLGTSMQMQPASELPCEAGRMVIVNLQPTQKDDEAWMVMRARLDDVMFALMAKLRIPIPVSHAATAHSTWSVESGADIHPWCPRCTSASRR